MAFSIFIFGQFWKQYVVYWSYQVTIIICGIGNGMYTVLAPRYVEEIVLNKDFTFCMAMYHLV
jgi:hypothetical protein